MTRRDARLDLARQRAWADIDQAAGRARARYITVAPGQEGVYLLKAEQARQYLDAGAPEDASAWPLVALEAEAREMAPAALAAEILSLRDAWTAKAAQIEAARLAGKRAVALAADGAAIDAALHSALAALSVL